MPDAIIAADPKFSAAQADSNQILWLALTLPPGLGPTRSRRLVEFFGTVDRVFSASLTELEASGLPVQSAQALATGAGQLNLLMKKWRAQRRRTYTCWLLTIPHIPLDCGRSTILPWCSTVGGCLGELPQDVRLALTPPAGAESQAGQTASLFEEPSLSPHEKKIYSVLKADEAMHLDEIIEKLEPALSSSEIFAALFEQEQAGKVKQLPGETFVKSF